MENLLNTSNRPFSILFVVSTDISSISERNITRLAIQNERNGGVNYAYCGHSVCFFQKRNNKKIKLISIEKSQLNQFQEVMLIYKQIRKLKIDLVHSFTLKNIIGLSLTVRQFPRIPLFLSLDSLSQLNVAPSVLKRIRLRLDKIIIMDDELIYKVSKKILVHPGKFEVAVPEIVEQGYHRVKTDKFIIGTYLKSLNNLNEKLEELFQSIDIIKIKNKINLEFVIFVDDVISGNETVNENKYSVKNFTQNNIQNIHLWFSDESDFLVDDFILQAIVNSIPVLGTRNPTLKKLLSRQEMSGETFNPENTAELRNKLEMIVINFEKYKTLAISAAKNIRNSKFFKKSIFSIYDLAILRRKRLVINK